jgi:hypothetical protein
MVVACLTRPSARARTIADKTRTQNTRARMGGF